MGEFFEKYRPFIILLGLCIVATVWVCSRDIENTQTAEIRIDNKIYSVSEICNMTELGGNIYYDKITGVLYYRDNQAYGGGYTPIYKADGTLKTIEDLK